MKKIKLYSIIFVIAIALFILPTISNASDVQVNRNIYTNTGSMKFEFSGLTLDTSHNYQFGITKTQADEIETWFNITDYTETTAVVDVNYSTSEIKKVVDLSDKVYITIKDANDDSIIVEKNEVDVKMPYLKVSNYTVIPNGKEFDISETNGINIPLRNPNKSKAYFQYEKITDSNIINKYNEIKNSNGDYNELQDILSETPPSANWKQWGYFNGFSFENINGYGYPERKISVPDTGLYYLWMYFSTENAKDVYGYILVDNLDQNEISLDSISLPQTAEVELGKTLTLTPKFSPSDATNKIVTWSSSDESVATVDNAGNVTPKKIGSTIITVTSQDGSKKATCTVTVTLAQNNGNTNNSNNTSNGNLNNGTTSGGNKTSNSGNGTSKNDSTMSKGSLPKTGLSLAVVVVAVTLFISCIGAYYKYNKLKDI